MGKMVHNAEFEGEINNSIRQVTVVATTGTATLQAQAGDSWVDVPDSTTSGSTNFTFHAPHTQRYRFNITGDAEVWLT